MNGLSRSFLPPPNKLVFLAGSAGFVVSCAAAGLDRSGLIDEALLLSLSLLN
jgi:hypothetical protein